MIVRRSYPWRQLGRAISATLAVYTLIAVAVSVSDFLGWHEIRVPALPLSLIAAVLGILLGFRNNSGYDRWWEARTLWGGVVNQSRSFARQVLTFLPAGDPEGDGERRTAATRVVQSRLLDTALEAPVAVAVAAEWSADGGDGAVRDADGAARPARGAGGASTGAGLLEPVDGSARASAEARELIYAQLGFVNAMRCHLRREDPIPAVAPFFAPAVVEALRGEQNVPAAILAWIATRLRRVLDGRRSDDTFRLVALDDTLSELTNLLGGCERIKNTPIPRAYDWLPNAMVRVYLLLLPFGLVQELGLLTPIVTAVIAVLFLALDAIGRAVETPFEHEANDTPMTALCRTIEINLRQMLGEHDLPAAVQPVDGVLY